MPLALVRVLPNHSQSDITNQSKSVIRELQHKDYNKPIIDVEDPGNAIALLAQK